MKDTSSPGSRLVICCYCDARSLLPRQAEVQRLVCHGCGAPILKLLAREPSHRAKGKGGKGEARRAEPAGYHKDRDRACRRKKTKGKRKKGLLYRLREGVDDLFDLDDLLDVFDLD